MGRRTGASGLLGLTLLLGCAEGQQSPSAAEHELDAVASPLLAQVTSGTQAEVERAYAAALTRADAAWAREVAAGIAYVPDGEYGRLQVPQATVRVRTASLELELAARVAGPAQQVRVRDAECIGTTRVEAEARTSAEAGPQLLAACEDYAGLLPRGAGEEVRVALLGEVQCVAAVAGGPYLLSRFAQTCEARTTTTARCRETGVHPLPDCTYVAAPERQVRSVVQCTFSAGTWTCRGQDEDRDTFPPPVAQQVARALNDSQEQPISGGEERTGGPASTP